MVANVRRQAPAAPRMRQRRAMAGLGLLETLLLVLLLGGALAAGVVWFKAREASLRAEEQSGLLRQADRYLAGFAAANFRLPCPAYADTDGVEDCSRGQKGLLPYRTLGLDGSAAHTGIGRLAYLVYRGATADLAVARNNFEPSKWNGAPHGFNQIGSPDFCQALTQAMKEGSASAARVFNGASGRNVAYALAHPGAADADGDGSAFDGRNAGAAAEMEAPERGAASGAYDDRVLARGFADLALAADCPRLTASLDGMALAADVVDEVNDQKLMGTIIASGTAAADVAKTAGQVVKVVTSVIRLNTAVTVLAMATSILAASTASCVVIVGCFEIPHAAVSVTAATMGVIASTAAISINVLASVARVTATALDAAVAIKYGIALGELNIDLTEAVDKAYAAWQDSLTLVSESRAKLDQLSGANAGAQAAQASAWNDLIAQAHSVVDGANRAASPAGTMSPSAYDYLLNDVRSKAVALQQARLNVVNAEDALETARKMPQGSGDMSSQTQQAIATMQAQIDAEKAKVPPDQAKIDGMQKGLDQLKAQLAGTGDQSQQVAQLKTQIADLQNHIATETDPERKAQAQASLERLQSQLAALDVSVSGKEAALALAKSQRDAAQAQYDSARQTAIDAFRIRYCVTTTSTTSDDPPKTVTTTDCGRYYDGRSAIASKIDAFLSAYDKAYAGMQKVAAAQSSYDQAVSSADQAKSAYESLKAVANGEKPAGSASQVWAGAESILRAADLKGGAR